MQKKGIIVLISGPSGVGKGTILEQLINDPNLNLTFSISMTTRAKRAHEVDGEHYFFVTPEEFAKNIAQDNFLEHATFVNNSYGTPKDYVYNLLDAGKNVLIEIEVQGAKMLLERVDPADIISFYIMPPSVDDLILRLRGRGTETEEVILKRAAKYSEEVKFKDQYDHAIVNDDLDECVLKVKEIIMERLNNK